VELVVGGEEGLNGVEEKLAEGLLVRKGLKDGGGDAVEHWDALRDCVEEAESEVDLEAETVTVRDTVRDLLVCIEGEGVALQLDLGDMDTLGVKLSKVGVLKAEREGKSEALAAGVVLTLGVEEGDSEPMGLLLGKREAVRDRVGEAVADREGDRDEEDDKAGETEDVAQRVSVWDSEGVKENVGVALALLLEDRLALVHTLPVGGTEVLTDVVALGVELGDTETEGHLVEDKELVAVREGDLL